MTDARCVPGSDLIRIPEAATRLGIKGAAVYELIDLGHLPGWKSREGLMVTSAEAVAQLIESDSAR